MKKNVLFTVLELASIVVLVATLGYIAYSWGRMPQTIPTHFNFRGEITSWGNKKAIWAIFALHIGIYLVMSWSLFKIPRYLKSIKDPLQYFAGRKLMELTILLTKLEVTLIIALLIYCAVGAIALPLIIFYPLLAITIITIAVSAFKFNRFIGRHFN